MNFFKEGELKLLWPFYLESFLGYLVNLFPAFVVLFFLDFGFSLTQIGFLLAIVPLTTLIFEIPTGAIADIYGRKPSVLTGYLLEGVAYFSMFFAKNFYTFVLLLSLLGFATTFSSGSKESWVFDKIKSKNRKLANSYFSKSMFLNSLGLIISGIIGAQLVFWFGLKIIWLATSIGFFISFIILLPVGESEHHKRNKKESVKGLLSQSKKSIKYASKHPVISYLLLAGFFMTLSVVFAEAIGYVPFLKDLGFPDHYFGYFWSGVCLVGGIAPLFAEKFRGKRKETNFLILFTALGSITLLLITFINNYALAVGIIILALFFYSTTSPVEKTYFHKFIPSKIRATVTSFQSMVYSLGGIIALPIGGYLADIFGPRSIIIISALFGIPMIISYYLVKENVREKGYD